MNLEICEKIRLLETIQSFMYDAKFSDLHVFSKQYLGSILYSMYQDNSDNDFCFAFGDLDKVRAINDKFSVQVGDRVMHDGIQVIKDNLPENTLISRVAGDEFIFLAPGIAKSKMDSCITDVNSSLTSQSDILHDLNITMSSMDSTIFPDFLDLYEFTETNVTNKKKKVHQDPNSSKDEVLHDKIVTGFRNYFNYYRLNDFKTQVTFPNKYFHVLRDSLIDITINNLEKKGINIGMYFDRSISKEVRNLKYFKLPSLTAKTIHSLATSEYLDIEQLDSVKLENLRDIAEFVIRDPISGQYSNEYFRKFLLPKIAVEPAKKLCIQVFDLLHLKLSNDIINHNNTDQKISQLFGCITNKLKQNIDFTDTNHETGNYLISLGTKLLCVEQGDFSISEKEIDSTLAKARENQRILDVLPSRASCINLEIIDAIHNLDESCSSKKHELKINKISQSETIIPLSIALGDSINYYLSNFDNPCSMKHKQAFTVKLFEGMAEVVSERYKTQPIPNLNVDYER